MSGGEAGLGEKTAPPQKGAPRKVAATAKAAPVAKGVKKATPARKHGAAQPIPGIEPTEAPAPAEVVQVKQVKEAVEVKAPTHPVPVPRAETDRWAKLLADPVHTPELLALAAVESIGPRARDWASSTRSAYPAATPDALARLATRQFTRFGTLASVFGAVAGSYASIALLTTRTLTDAELILHVAAAHGLDPTDPERAADLLVITGVHESADDAESALTAMKDEPTASGLGDAVWRVGRLVFSRTGGWTALRLINRVYPGTSLLGAVLTSTTTAQATAARAISYYRKRLGQAGSVRAR